MPSRFLALAAALAVLAACTPRHAAGPDPKIKPQPKPEPVAMSPVSYLRKLSFHIRGQTPERAEYAELTRAIEQNQVDQFFKEKTTHYLKSREHIDKMSFRIEELLHLRATPVPYHSPLLDLYKAEGPLAPTAFDEYIARNSLNELVRQVVAQNQSWDTLLTGKSYRAFPLAENINALHTGDFLFFSDAAGVPSQSQTEAPVVFAADDTRVAGILTTGRFFGRYVNTALNQNRKRAAAIFRTFLCDDMKAVVVDESGNQNEILDKVFPGPGGNSLIGGGQAKSSMPDPHGTDPACMKCHYKLDPMGKTFQESGMILAPLASPGALVYTRANGGKVNIPVAGVGQLAQAITEQPEYVNCQVGHFWRWYIGEDKPLTPVVAAELAAKFEEVKRQPNDFIAYLVSRPEFGFVASQESNAELVTAVKRVLKNCNGCHALEGVPSFTDWPIGGTESRHQKMLGFIRNSLALDGSSKPRWMPPKNSSWQPSPADLATLQRWFDMGAPNE